MKSYNLWLATCLPLCWGAEEEKLPRFQLRPEFSWNAGWYTRIAFDLASVTVSKKGVYNCFLWLALLCSAALQYRLNAYCKRLYTDLHSALVQAVSHYFHPTATSCMQDHNQQTGRPAGQLQDTTVFSILCIVILLFLNSIGIFEWDVCWSTSHKTRT